MSKMQRDKGKAGEREIAAIVRDLTGLDIRRRVRQHDGDSDLEGAPGWCVEVKRHARATRSDIKKWWAQAVAQSAAGEMPVLFFRLDRDEWRAVWPCAGPEHVAYEWTAETDPAAWAAAMMAAGFGPRVAGSVDCARGDDDPSDAFGGSD